MISALCKLWSSPIYDTGDFIKDIEERGTCCVPIDSDLREERCCKFTGLSAESDFFDCGYEGEMKEKSALEYNSDRLKRYMRHLLIIQIIFWGILGVTFSVRPDLAQFDIMMNDAYVNSLNVDSYRHFQIESEHPDFSFSHIINNIDITNLFSKLIADKDTSPTEKEMFITHTNQVIEGMIKHSVETTIATPTRMLGILFTGFTFLSLISRINKIDLLYFSTTPHIIWAAAGIACAATSSSSTSGYFTFFIATFNLFFFITWIIIREKTNILILQIKKESNSKKESKSKKKSNIDDLSNSDSE